MRVLYDPNTIVRLRCHTEFRAFMSSQREVVESLWKEFFRDPSQFNDIRNIKKDHRSPDFLHKFTGKALWINGLYNPPWVYAKLQRMTMEHVEVKVNHDREAIIQLIKSCGKKKNLSMIRRLCTENDWITEDTVIATTLIRSYAKCGALKDAREVFDKLEVRDTVCWNALISGYADQGFGEEAIECFRNMVRDRVMPDSVTYVSTLKACAIVQALEIVQKIHARVREQELLNKSIVLGNMLVNAYGKCGALKEAQEVFEQLASRDTVSWNALIAGYADQGLGKEALTCFREMGKNKVIQDLITYTCALKACAIVGDVELVKEIHTQVRKKVLLNKDFILGSMLVSSYANCGALKEARDVFEELEEPNVVCWTGLIDGYADQGFGYDALRYFREMENNTVTPDSVTYICILKACGIIGSIEIVDEIHARVRNQGLLTKDIALKNMLIDAYAKCGAMKEARDVFDELADHDAVSWNVMIAGYVDEGLSEEAISCFRDMQKNRVAPDSVTYTCTLKACAIEGALEIVNEIHLHIREQALLNKDIVLGSMLVDVYAKCGAMMEAREAFDQLAEPDVVSWTSLMVGYVAEGLSEEALKCFREMQRNKVKPNLVTYMCALKASAIVGVVDIVKEIHAQMRDQCLLNEDILLRNTLIDAYAKCGAVKEAWEVFEELTEPNVVSWTALIAAYARVGCVNEMLDSFNMMTARGIYPDPVTYTVLLNGCSHGALLDEGQMLFGLIGKHGLVRTPEHYMCMVDLFGRCGQLNKSKVFVLDDSTATLMAFMGACGKWVNVNEGRWAFGRVLQLDRKCVGAYVCMANIYAEAGMLKEANQVELLRVNEKSWKKPASVNVGAKLNILHDILTKGHFPDFHQLSISFPGHEKENVLFYHGEKLGLAYVLIY